MLLALGGIPVACSIVTDIARGKVYNIAVVLELVLLAAAVYATGRYISIVYLLALLPFSMALFSAGLGGGDCKLLLVASALLSTLSLKAGVYMCMYFLALLHPAWYLHRKRKIGAISAVLAAIPLSKLALCAYPVLLAISALNKRGVLAAPLIMLAYIVAASSVA